MKVTEKNVDKKVAEYRQFGWKESEEKDKSTKAIKRFLDRKIKQVMGLLPGKWEIEKNSLVNLNMQTWITIHRKDRCAFTFSTNEHDIPKVEVRPGIYMLKHAYMRPGECVPININITRTSEAIAADIKRRALEPMGAIRGEKVKDEKKRLKAISHAEAVAKNLAGIRGLKVRTSYREGEYSIYETARKHSVRGSFVASEKPTISLEISNVTPGEYMAIREILKGGKKESA